MLDFLGFADPLLAILSLGAIVYLWFTTMLRDINHDAKNHHKKD